MVDKDENSFATETWRSIEEECLALKKGLLNNLLGQPSLNLSQICNRASCIKQSSRSKFKLHVNVSTILN